MRKAFSQLPFGSYRRASLIKRINAIVEIQLGKGMYNRIYQLFVLSLGIDGDKTAPNQIISRSILKYIQGRPMLLAIKFV